MGMWSSSRDGWCFSSFLIFTRYWVDDYLPETSEFCRRLCFLHIYHLSSFFLLSALCIGTLSSFPLFCWNRFINNWSHLRTQTPDSNTSCSANHHLFLKAFSALWNKLNCLLNKSAAIVLFGQILDDSQSPRKVQLYSQFRSKTTWGFFLFFFCFFVVPKFKVQFYSAFVIDFFSSQSRRKMSALVHKWNFAPVLLSFYSIIIFTVVHGQILCWPSGQNLFSLTWGCIRDVNLSPSYIKMNH